MEGEAESATSNKNIFIYVPFIDPKMENCRLMILCGELFGVTSFDSKILYVVLK